MAEENLDPVVAAAEPATQAEPSTPQYTEAEQEALKQGWVPEDQWEGNGKWRPAEEFLDRGELFGKIDEQRRAIKSLESTQAALKQHLDTVRRTEYTRALQELKAQRKEALAEGDADAVVQTEERMEALKFEAAKAEQAAQQQAQAAQEAPSNPVLLAWMGRNPWYQSDKAMKIFADEQGHRLALSGLTDHRELLVEIERRVKREFPDKFNNPNRGKPSAVDAGGNSKGSSRRDSFELSDVEKQMMHRLVRAIPGFTEEQYIADIKAARAQGK